MSEQAWAVEVDHARGEVWAGIEGIDETLPPDEAVKFAHAILAAADEARRL